MDFKQENSIYYDNIRYLKLDRLGFDWIRENEMVISIQEWWLVRKIGGQMGIYSRDRMRMIWMNYKDLMARCHWNDENRIEVAIPN